jgi:hypothetical protein
MRLEQKYFVPFMLAVALLCVLLITYFNFRSAGQQQQNFTDRIAEGRELYTHSYPTYFQDDAISPDSLASIDSGHVAILFWASWSDRSVTALHELQEIAREFHAQPEEEKAKLHIVAAAIKDGENYIDEIRQETASSAAVYFVEGDEIYNELRLPGLPAIVVFDAAGNLYGARYGFSSAADYAFIRQLHDLPAE